MRLVVATPTEIVEDVADIRSVRAEDDTGAFGIEPGHADFVTVLPISIVTWRSATQEGHVVVRGGVLTVQDGNRIDVAARGAWREDQLSRLGPAALADLQRADEEESVSRKSEHGMHLAMIRQIERWVRDDHQAAAAPRIAARDPDAEQGA